MNRKDTRGKLSRKIGQVHDPLNTSLVNFSLILILVVSSLVLPKPKQWHQSYNVLDRSSLSSKKNNDLSQDNSKIDRL